jgi:hypothetical protein
MATDTEICGVEFSYNELKCVKEIVDYSIFEFLWDGNDEREFKCINPRFPHEQDFETYSCNALSAAAGFLRQDDENPLYWVAFAKLMSLVRAMGCGVGAANEFDDVDPFPGERTQAARATWLCWVKTLIEDAMRKAP